MCRRRFKVIRQVRPKLACAGCERIVQAQAPSRPIERGSGRTGPVGARAGVEILRSSSAVSPVGNLRAGRRGAGTLDAGGLGGRHERVACAAGGSAAASRAERRQAARRRHAGSGAGSRKWKNKNRTAVDVCARRPSRGRRNASGSMVRLLAGSQGRASAAHLGQFTRHAAGRWLRGIRCGVRNGAHSGSGLLGACAAESSTICTWRIDRRSLPKRSNASPRCMPSKKKFAATQRTSGARSATRKRGLCWTR